MNPQCTSQFIMDENETLQLLTAFFHEAIVFMNIPKEACPEIRIGVYFTLHGPEPIHIDYVKRKIIINIPFFRYILTLNPNSKNDSPTVYRTYGYRLAYTWYRYLTTGEKRNFSHDFNSILFAEALTVVKGIPLLPPANINPYIKDLTGFDPNDKRPILKMFKDKFGMDCMVNRGFDMVSRQIIEGISFTPEENRKRGGELAMLYKESVSRPTPTIDKSGPGTMENPFQNIDEAADYILKIEQEYLKTDRYRQRINDEQFYYDFERNYFRVSWASPNVGYYHLEDAQYPCFVANQLELREKDTIPRFSLKPSLRKNKFLYRGQAEFFSPCRPSLFREPEKQYYVDDIIQINEMEVLLRKYPLVKLFEQGFMLMNEFIRFKVNYVGLSQHYYNRTSLLDLTSDIEVAKFFAVTQLDVDNDCYVEYKGDELGVLYYYDIKADTFTTQEGHGQQVEAIGKQPFMRSGNQSGFLINLKKNDDFNLLPNVRYVFFRHNPHITSRIFKESQNGDKYMPQEILRTHWHNRITNEVEKKKVSMEALMLNIKNNPHESPEHIKSELIKKGFNISSEYKSEFTEEELECYYSNSESIWNEFCSNIHFYGPEGKLLKKHLQNLPNDKRYRWAFYRD